MLAVEATLIFLSADEIKTSIRWLLENASPPVRYLTCKHILKTDPQSKPMQELWKDVEHGSDAEDHNFSVEPTDRKQLLLEWFGRNTKPDRNN